MLYNYVSYFDFHHFVLEQLFSTSVCYFSFLLDDCLQHNSTAVKLQSGRTVRKKAYLDFWVYLWWTTPLSRKPQTNTCTEYDDIQHGVICSWMLEMFKLVYTAEIHCVLIAVFFVVFFCLFFVPTFGLKVSLAPVSLHVACKGKVNAQPVLSPLLPSSSSLCPAMRTSNYRVCDGYYNTDLPG